MAGIFRSMSTVFALSLAAKGLAFVRDIALVNRIGAGNLTDTFYAALTLVDLIIIFSGLNAFKSVATTTFTRESAGGRDASVYFTALIGCLGGYGLLVSLPLVIAPRAIAGLLLPGFTPDRLILTAEWLRILGLVVMLRGVAQVFGNLLGVRRQFGFFNALMVIVNASALLAILFSPQSLVVRNLCIAMTSAYGVATLASFGVLIKPATRLVRIPAQALRSHGSGFIKLTIPLLFITTAFSLAGIVDKAVASYFPGGVITALSLAFALSAFPVNLLLVPVSDVYFPHFSRLYHEKNLTQLNIDFNKAQQLVICIFVPIAVFVIFFCREIVAAAYLRKNFTMDNVIQTAAFLRIYGISMLFNALYWISSFLFQATGKNNLLGKLGMAGYAINIAGSIILSRILGPMGIPLGSVLCFLFFFSAGHWLLQHHCGIGLQRRNLLYILAFLAAALLAGWVTRQAVLLFEPRLASLPAVAPILLLGLISGIYAAITALITAPLTAQHLISFRKSRIRAQKK